MPEDEKRRMTEARKKANAKYESKAYDKILVRVESGKKNEIKAHAEQHQFETGEIGKPGYTPKGSINGFIARAINEAMERDIESVVRFARSVDMIGEVSPIAKQKILSGESGLTMDYIREICNMSATKVKRIAKQIENADEHCDKSDG